MGSAFSYPHRLTNSQIRLLRIEPASPDCDVEGTLDTVSLDDDPVYNALSYLWGDPKVTSNITINGTKFGITENLNLALRHIRNEHTPVVFWIDAICINQKSNDEKSIQVPLMGKIYSMAIHVYAFLGPEADNSSLAFDLMKRWTHAFETSLDRHEPDLDHALDVMRQPNFLESIDKAFDASSLTAMRSLMLRPYWRRVWVQQELLLARNATLLCGSSTISFKRLHYFSYCHAYFTNVRVEQLIPFDFVEAILNDVPVLSFKELSHRSTWHQLQVIRTCSATDPRDMIYGILGCITIPNLSLIPDYSQTVEWIYTDFCCKLIEATQKLCVDGSNGVGEHHTNAVIQGLPTWVPDFREPSPPFYGLLGKSIAGGSYVLSNDGSRLRTFVLPRDQNKPLLQSMGVTLGTVEQCVRIPETMDRDLVPMWELLVNHGLGRSHSSGRPWAQAFFRTIFRISTSPEESEESEYLFTQLAVAFMHWIGRVAIKQRYMHPSLGELIRSLPAQDDGASKREFEEIFNYGIPNYVRNFIIGAGLDVDLVIERCTTDGVFNIKRLQDMPEQDLLSVFCGRSGSPDSVPWKSIPNMRPEAIAPMFYDRLRRAIFNRSIFVIPQGYVGLGPVGSAVGDKLCILVSNDLPLVLRQGPDHCHDVVGACFVDGVMGGEEIIQFGEKLQAGKIQGFVLR